MAAGLVESGVEAPMATLVVGMALSSFMLGAFEVLLGAARFGRAVQFVPSPVIAGFIASMGYIQLDLSSKMVTGCSILNARCLTSARATLRLQLLLGLVGGMAIQIAQQLERSKRITPFLVPALLISFTLCFQLIQAALPEGALDAWVIAVPDGSDEATLYDGFGIDLREADVPAAAHAALELSLTAALPACIGRLLTASAFEQLAHRDVRYSLMLRELGIAHIAGTPGLIPFTPSLAAITAAITTGATSTLPAVMNGIVSAVLVVVGPAAIVALIPTALLAAILSSLSFGLLWRELLGAVRNFTRAEGALVVAHVLLTASMGMMYAVGLGILATAVLFIIEYSAHSGVSQTATVELERSDVMRSPAETAILSTRGASVFIVHLHGVLYFGSANQVVKEVRAHLKTLAELCMPLEALILDFERCTAVDSSAVRVLLATERLIGGAPILIAAATDSVLAGMRTFVDAAEIVPFGTMNLALESAENTLLTSSTAYSLQPSGDSKARGHVVYDETPESTTLVKGPAPSVKQPFFDVEKVRARVASYLINPFGEDLSLLALVDRMDYLLLPPQTVINDETDPAPALYIVDAGYVSVSLHILGRKKRVLKGSTGTVLGIASLVQHWRTQSGLPLDSSQPAPYHDVRAVSVADTYCHVLRLPATECAKLEREEPQLAIKLWRFLLRLSESRYKQRLVDDAASSAFQVSVRPSSSFVEVLLGQSHSSPAAGEVSPTSSGGSAPSPAASAHGGVDDAVGSASFLHRFSQFTPDLTRRSAEPLRRAASHSRASLANYQDAVRTSHHNAKLKVATSKGSACINRSLSGSARTGTFPHDFAQPRSPTNVAFGGLPPIRSTSNDLEQPPDIESGVQEVPSAGDQRSGVGAHSQFVAVPDDLYDSAGMPNAPAGAEKRRPVPAALSLDSFEWHQRRASGLE